ncbi:hypothetical protein ACTXT7_013982 [Hymenolepis weldensis]
MNAFIVRFCSACTTTDWRFVDKADELSTSSPQIKRSPLTRPNYEFSADDKVNILSVENSCSQQLQNSPISTDGFLSKQLGQEV